MKIFILSILIFLMSCGSDYLGIKNILVSKELKNGYNILGDSMAACASINGYSDCWQGLISEYENYGVSGSMIEYIPITIDYDKTIIFCGFNNLKHDYESIDSIVEKYKVLLSRIPTETICISVTPINHSMSTTWYPEGDWITNNRVNEFNQKISTLCDHYIDLYSAAIDGDECKPEYSEDGIHPSQSGYDFITNILNEQ